MIELFKWSVKEAAIGFLGAIMIIACVLIVVAATSYSVGIPADKFGET